MATLPFDVFWRDHGAKAGLKGLSKEAQEAARRQDEFKAKATLAGAIVGAALLKLGKNAVDVASDINESQSKVQVVFGKSAAEVEKLADTSAKAMGISKRSYLDAAGTLGNLFVSLKLPQGEAAKMSTRMIQLAADMASFNNASPEEALEALRAGLVGETEPLRRFGVNLNDAALREKALAMGLVSTTKDTLPAAVKAQAVYALAIEQSATAHGDFARTSDSLANRQRILTAEFEDLQGELGQKLLPVAVATAGALIDLVEFLDEHGKAVGIVAGSFAAVAGGIYAINKASAGVKAASAAWDTMSAAMASFAREGGKGRAALGSMTSLMIGPWGVALAAGGAALAYWIKKQADARAHVDDLKRSLDEQTGAITKATRATVYDELVKSGAVRTAKGLGIALDDLTDAALGNAAAQGRVRGAVEDVMGVQGQSVAEMGRMNRAMSEGQRDALGLLKAVEGQNGAVNAARQAWRDASDAGVVAADSTDDLTGSIEDNTDAVEDNTAAVEKRDRLLSKRGAQRAFEAAIDDATDALKDNGRTLDVSTEKGRRNGEALDNLAEAANDYRKAISEAKGSTEQQNRVQARAYDALVKTARQMGMGKRQADRYARAVLGIPNKHTTKVNTDTKQATRNLVTLKERLRSIPPKWVTVGAVLRYPSTWTLGRYGMKAAGGPIGDGVGTVDEVPILAMRGEHMWTTREVQAAGGHDAMHRIRRAALRGELKGYAAGGPIGWTTPRGFSSGVSRMESVMEDVAVTFGRKLQAKLDAVGAGSIGGGWRSMWAAVHRQFPWAALHSAYRPGAITATGNRSYHSMGRAIDVSPSMAIFEWWRQHYGARTKELIYSPAGGRQIWNGRNHYYGEPTRGMHWNHVHIAYDQGGVASGRGWIPKATPAPERVLSPRQTSAFEDLVRANFGAAGSRTVNVTLVAPNYVGSHDDLVRALETASRQGRLRPILQREGVVR